MATIAVLGMGLLGRGFAENLLDWGHRVQVWNRTGSKCAPVVAKGAVRADSPADAARGADRVHLVLSEDTAVDAVIAAMAGGLAPGTPIVDHSTNLPAKVAERSQRVQAYVHAPVFMGPANSREGTGLMLVSGPRVRVAPLLGDLATMTGRVLDLGDRADKAAAIKIIGNGMLVMLTAAMGDLFALGESTGVEADEIIALFEQFSPTPAGMGKRVLASGDAPVGFELTMARKDTGLMIASAGAVRLTVLPAVAEAMDRAISEGRGAEDFTALVRPGVR